MARQQIVPQAVQQLAQNVNFKVDAYIQREKKLVSLHYRGILYTNCWVPFTTVLFH